MALLPRTRLNQSTSHPTAFEQIVHHTLLIPEAPLVAVITLLAWLLNFPALLGLLATAVVVWFFVRSALLLVAEQRLLHGDIHRAEWLARAARQMHPWSTDAQALYAQVHDAPIQHTAPQSTTTPYHDALSTDSIVTSELLYHYAYLALHADGNAARSVDLLEQTTFASLPAHASTPLLLLLAEAYITLERCEDARAALQRVEAQIHGCTRVQRSEALYLLGCLWKALGADARRYFRHCVEVDPEGRYARDAWRKAASQ